MKDMYDLFGNIEIDIDEYENSNIEAPKGLERRMRRNFRKNILIKKGKLYSAKKIGKVAVFALVLVSFGTITSTVFAKNIPIVGSFVNYLQNRSTISNEVYAKYAKNMTLSSVDKKISVQLESVLYDGSYLYLAYKIQGENKESLVNNENDINIKQLVINNVNVELDKKIFKSQGIKNNYKTYDTEIVYDFDKADNNTIVTRVDIKNTSISDTSNIDLSIDKIGKVSGNWEFKFQVNKSELVDRTKRYENLGQLNVNDKVKLDLNAITFSPLGTTVENTIIAPNDSFKKFIDGKFTNLGFSYVFITDKGEEVFSLGERILSSNNDKDALVKRYSRFTSLNEAPKSLTIIPVIQKEEQLKIGFENYKYIKLKDINKGQYISQGKDCGVTINNINKNGGNTVVSIKFNGIDISRRSNIFLVKDLEKYKRYNSMDEGKDKDKMYLDSVLQTLENQHNVDITRHYSKDGNDYTFENANDECYLAIPQYDGLYSLDMENAKTINFVK
ncbi:DUF4179 domain-containing protein [Clostridium manihotivorum]|uniref:DUF4179 domain-containing protein n=1 Tax=Clostridium manihotivorum TaxID=2320868 RepID=A0A3R5R2B9_9CLOT|nr:DUF4179 domain-containing protein [Clostridium manihotivorum]QAA35172.1 hypothetical protein C1I91_27950 [Clostridium manihotivorum]